MYNHKKVLYNSMRKYRKQDVSPERWDRYLLQHRLVKRRRRAERLEQAISMLGGKCVQCGCTDHSRLQFHHEDKSTKQFEIAECPCVSYERFLAEIKKCTLLCMGCHLRVSWDERRQETGITLTDLSLLEITDDEWAELVPEGGRKLRR